MDILSLSDILALNRAIGDIYAVHDLESFYRLLLDVVQSFVPCGHCSFNELDLPVANFLRIIYDSDELNLIIGKHSQALNTHIRQHPLFAHCTSAEVIKTTDYTSINRFKTTALYNEFYRHIDTEMQITFSLPVSQHRMGLVALSRVSTDFSEVDRLKLTLLKPHCVNAFRNVTELDNLRLERNLLLRGADEQRQGVVLCRQEGLIICISELAGEMLGRYFAAICAEGGTLPEALKRWLATETRLKFAHQVERKAFVIEKNGKSLTIKLVCDITSNECILLMTESDPSAFLRNLHRYGLSPRETEVLCWLLNGKTNVEMAIILGISKRTADKHMERIFIKLGVETRAAAVALIRNEL